MGLLRDSDSIGEVWILTETIIIHMLLKVK